MTMQYNCWEPVVDTRVLFKDLVSQNKANIIANMKWENYELNETIIPAVSLVKEHALMVLSKSYGLFHVEQDILDTLCADVFIYFPILLQQLSITRLVDSVGVVKMDTNTQKTTRTDIVIGNVEQNSSMTAGTTVTDNNVLNTQQKTTGTVSIANDTLNVQESTTTIDNTSGVLATGNKSVNLNHNMPEQSINGSTGNIPSDAQGTPILTNSFIQAASESFNTSNPINTTEHSSQDITNTNTGNNDSVTTNNVTLADTGTTTRTSVNSGSDSSDSIVITDTTNTVTEDITNLQTNKQYAYEIKTFLETADSLIAFSRWEDKFSWVVGIV